MDAKLLSAEEAVEMERTAQAEIDVALEFAKASPFPRPVCRWGGPLCLTSALITYPAALNEALRDEMRQDPSVIVMGEEVAVWGDGGGVFGVTKGLADEFGPARVRNTPISEEGIVALGVGAALTGMRPVVELMYGDFLTLAMEPLVNQAAKMRYMFGGQAQVPLVLRSNVGASGGKAAQHSPSRWRVGFCTYPD